MAIDPRIALAVQPVDMVTALTDGIKAGELIRQRGFRDTLAEEQAKSAKMTNVATQGKYLNAFVNSLYDVPYADRATLVSQNMKLFEQMGIPLKEVVGQDYSDNGLKKLADATAMFGQQAAAQDVPADVQTYEYHQRILKDPNSTDDQIKASRIALNLEEKPSADKGASIRSSAPAQDPNSGRWYIPTYDPATNTTGVNWLDVPAGATAAEARQAEIDQQRALEEVKTKAAEERKENELLQTQIAQKKEKYGNARQAAAGALIGIEEAFVLAQQSSQGLGAQAKIFLSRMLPGVNVSDEAALSAALTNIAVNRLQTKFTGPTTDFELGVVQSTVGSVGDSKSANIARINAMKRAEWFVNREAEQFDRWIDAGNDVNRFSFNYDEIVPIGSREYTLKQLHMTAAQNHITMDEVIARLNANVK